MARVVAVLFCAGCQEYGLDLGIHGGDRPNDADPPGAGGQGADDPGEADGFDPLPGEDLPPGWTDWDRSCANADPFEFGVHDDRIVISDPIDGLSALITVGNLALVPRPGPVEVVASGSGNGELRIEDGILVIDYVGTVGNLTVYAPPDLQSYDFRLCVGNIDFEGVAGVVSAEARTGNIDGRGLVADTAFAHDRIGNVDLQFDAPPAGVFVEGVTGNHDLVLPIDACDCDLDVDVGNVTLRGIDDDPSAQTEVFAFRRNGNVTVRQ
ncbi:MAG: hypothetical protein ABMA64_23630 [Myxococcota bacterium]